MQKQLQRLVEINILEKELKAEKEALTKDIIEDFGDESVSVNWYTVSKAIRRTPKLKEGITVDQIKKEFPTAVEFKVDIKELEQIPSAHQ